MAHPTKHLITIPPRLDMEAATKLHGDWQTIIENHDEIVMECTHLQQLSTAGLQLLITFKKTADTRGKKCSFRHISSDIMADLEILGATEYFN